MVINILFCTGMAYLLGGVCTGYWLVRIRRGLDIREYGSGGVGARNVGRILGKSGFIFTFLGDLLKGVMAVALARGAGLTTPILCLVVVAVIAGHIWPFFLQFRGGRGVATAIGAYLAFDLHLVLLLSGLTLLIMIFRGGFVITGLTAFLLLPALAWALLDYDLLTTAFLAGASAMILFAHRSSI